MTMPLFENYIDGAFSQSDYRFDSVDPSTGQPWASMARATPDDVHRAVAAAKRAFHSEAWRSLTATARGKLLFTVADLLVERSVALAAVETRDTGKIIRETQAQIVYASEYYRYYAGLADKIEGAHLSIDKADMEVWLRREPVGVVAAVVPWNSQLFLAAVKIAPAIAAGCTIVVKASEQGAAPLLMFAQLIEAAGFPPGVINIFTGEADSGAALVAHPEVNHVAFTGGPETARQVIQATANNLATTTLELGGKSPFIVFDDADKVSAVNAQVAGIFAACGQSCVAGSRLIVADGIKNQLLDMLKQKAESIKVGDPSDFQTEVGPLCTLAQRQKIDRIVSQSIQAGARCVTGGQLPSTPGYYYPPTILDCSHLKNGSSIASVEQELFGPVLSVLSFTEESEAIKLANASPYGLAAGVFTQNLSRAHRVIAALDAGIVWVNTYRAISPMVPFGGSGLSGNGREGGMQAMMSFTTIKSVWVRTSDEPIPDPFIMR